LSIWGKLLVGGTGLMLGGPLGAVLGLAVGHGVDKIRNTDSKNIKNSSQFGVNEKQMIFATGVIVLSAKLAKADGQVTEDEINTFRSVFDFEVSDEVAIGKIYNNAKLTASGYEIYAKQLKEVFGTQESLFVEFITALFKIALADGTLHPNELRMITDISKIFGMPQHVFDNIQNQFINLENYNNNYSALDEDYNILSCKADYSDEKIKENYLKLVKDYHPDTLISKGLPEEFERFANERLTEINNAYDRIKKSRQQDLKK
tara:strand:- start:72 stop:854 length:783 start_codon:yes stop_codon:yes gene_type:complete